MIDRDLLDACEFASKAVERATLDILTDQRTPLDLQIIAQLAAAVPLLLAEIALLEDERIAAAQRYVAAAQKT